VKRKGRRGRSWFDGNRDAVVSSLREVRAIERRGDAYRGREGGYRLYGERARAANETRVDVQDSMEGNEGMFQVQRAAHDRHPPPYIVESRA
jgi:hypothetical protein